MYIYWKCQNDNFFSHSTSLAIKPVPQGLRKVLRSLVDNLKQLKSKLVAFLSAISHIKWANHCRFIAGPHSEVMESWSTLSVFSRFIAGPHSEVMVNFWIIINFERIFKGVNNNEKEGPYVWIREAIPLFFQREIYSIYIRDINHLHHCPD